MQSKVKDGALNLSPEPGKEICDFCSSPEVNWDIDCEDIVLAFVASRGGWAACNTCKELVVSDQREALEKRALDTFMANHPQEGVPREIAEMFIHQLHTEFWKKHGEIRPYYRNAA